MRTVVHAKAILIAVFVILTLGASANAAPFTRSEAGVALTEPVRGQFTVDRERVRKSPASRFWKLIIRTLEELVAPKP